MKGRNFATFSRFQENILVEILDLFLHAPCSFNYETYIFPFNTVPQDGSRVFRIVMEGKHKQTTALHIWHIL